MTEGYQMTDEDHLAHYGILRRSGRYPWGSGGNVTSRSVSFLELVDKLTSEGMSPTEIAATFHTEDVPFTTTDLRALKSIAKNQIKGADIAMAQRLRAKGMSTPKIAERMGKPESTVRALLAPGEQLKADQLTGLANMLRDAVAEKTYVDVGSGVEAQLGISKERLGTAISMLKAEGYKVISVQEPQLGTNKKTTIKVLAPPGSEYRVVNANREKIQSLQVYSNDNGNTLLGIKPPLSISSKRVDVIYKEDGGDKADGVIYVRPGVEDISLGGNKYAQVRIMIDDSHYLKGMAMYKDDLPRGVDLQFNTNKKRSEIGTNKLAAMKKIKDDPDNPFGATIHQITGKDGKPSSAMNLVNEQGDWDRWSNTLSSQFLSKQGSVLAKKQLDLYKKQQQEDLDEILSLTNPIVRQKLLEKFADSADAASTHLKAAALPGQKNHVILPFDSLKENEVYAPNYKNGEIVALVRFPHGGIFEIPELVVNNNHRPAKKALGEVEDAIGINSKVAARLSGADFDGDSVLVIPNNPNSRTRVRTSPALAGLKNFDPQVQYPGYEGMKPMSSKQKQTQMGVVSNLITDMTIKNASSDEIAAAVRHSMVVIDAEKHKLNWKQSEIDNGITRLKQKYQKSSRGGASTVISQRKSEDEIPEEKLRSYRDGGPVNKKTGELVYVPTGATKTVRKVNKRTGETTVTEVPVTMKVSRLGRAKDANKLSSGTKIEKIYADHSNDMKRLANTARREAVNTKPPRINPSAKTAYAGEVASLNAKLKTAVQNKPRERQAQIIGNATFRAKMDANPDMDSADIKRLKAQSLAAARTAVFAKKQQIEITPKEWEAIQAGAISPSRLSAILDNTDINIVKEYATPKTTLLMTNTKVSRAKAMMAQGHTQAEVAAALGVSLTTLKKSLT